MKRLIGTMLLLIASASHAGHLDVISFTLDESCSVGTYLEIVDDFNEWGEAYGYQAEIAAPLWKHTTISARMRSPDSITKGVTL